MKRNPHRTVAAALLVMLLGFFAGISPASAAPIIDASKTGSLTIHKYLGATNPALPHDGSAVDPSLIPNEKLSGVVFDLYKVGGIDLTTNQGWLDAKALQAHPITAAEIAAGQIVVNGTTYTLTKVDGTPATPATVDSLSTVDGQLTYGSLPIGLYLVNENLGASTNITKPGTPNPVVVPAGSITPASPFLVTIPISYNTTPATTPPTDTWVYDINVYPKNTQDTITKQVLDGNIGTANQDAPKVGSNLTYRLDSSIPAAADYNNDGAINGADLGKYVVGDGLSPYVTYVSGTLSIVDKNGAPIVDGGTAITLTAGTDYTVSAPAGGTAGGPVVYTFTASGLNKLMRAKVLEASAHVVTDIVATVTSLPPTGVVPNQAYFIPSQGWYDSATNPDNGIPSNEVKSKYGDIVIKKTNNATPAQALEGAIFNVFRAPAFNSCATLDPATATPLATSLATNAQGFTALSGLQLSNWYNDGTTSGAITNLADYHNYCLVEIKAPNGYQLLAQPILFSLTVEGTVTDLSAAYADATRDAVVTDATGGNLLVVNMPDNLGNGLPLTGGQGVAVLSLFGLVLVGGGFGYYVMNSRKKHNA